ncbi:MAG: hypothetical protein K2O70_00575 [Desulfovibrionaceae bacterium]|nr:hypothetical protein [Desulfovibrionaceae bacterium]
MGYYSDTALTLTKKGVEALSNKLTDRETPEETRGEVQDLLSQADSHYTNSSSGAMVWIGPGTNGIPTSPKWLLWSR